MTRRVLAFAFGVVVIASAALAQQPTATRPPLLLKEEWKQPPVTGALTDENRRWTPEAAANPRVELKVYGPDARNVLVYEHEGRHDLWTGMVTSPVAIMVRDKSNFADLTGLARLRAVVRTSSLHALHPVVKLADGAFIAGSRAVATDGDFLQTEVAFGNQRWFKVDPMKVVTTVEVKNPDLSKVDEVGFVDFAPGGGHGTAGWVNVSTIELYANGVPR